MDYTLKKHGVFFILLKSIFYKSSLKFPGLRSEALIMGPSNQGGIAALPPSCSRAWDAMR